MHRALAAPAVAGDVAHPDRSTVLDGVGQREADSGALRDPDGNLVNFFTPVTPQARAKFGR
jgi:hypothetical protein